MLQRLLDGQVAASLAEASQQLGEALRTVLGELLGALVVLGAEQIPLRRT